MTVITSKYRTDVAKLFIDDVKVGNYYLFVSSTANTTVLNSESSKKEFLEKTIFGKRIDPEEIFYAIRNIPWQQDSVYAQYDDTVNLENSNYYVVVYPENNETGDYRIYKCLFNNYGAPSINAPNYSEVTPNQIYETADGYVWKYMYSLSETEFDKYNTSGFIPVFDTSNSNIDQTSEIDQIFVTNSETNRGYESVHGTIFQVFRGSENKIVISTDIGTTNPIENYYSNYTFYVTNANNVSQVYEIDSYVYNTATRATLTLTEGVPNDGILTESATFSILPQIKILGDGSGAVAIPKMTSVGTITNVIMINRGSGYSRAKAHITDPFGFDPTSLSSLDERVILRPVLSPRGGHSNNIAEELFAKHALIYNGFNEFDNDTIPTLNSFASVGIVKNPEFKTAANNTPDVFDNRIEIEINDHSLAVNEIVTQIDTNPASDFYNETSFSGKVHEISGNTIFISEYMGAFPTGLDTSNTGPDFSDISLNTELPLYSSQDEILVINTGEGSVVPSDYIQKTGEVYYMNSFAPITRTEESREQIKIIIEF